MGQSPRRVVLLLEYDGAGYVGSQLQKGRPTIQSVLEQAILSCTGEAARAAFAGRTDAGVHAKGQVGTFETRTRLSNPTLMRALNALLPEDVVIRAIRDVPADFDVRRAQRRHYRYVIDNRPARPAIARRYAWHVPQPLDVAAMAEAACRLVGRRDFTAFASRTGKASTIRRLERFSVTRQGAWVICDAVADAFLFRQVRRMVGALVPVGLGRRSVEEYAALLHGIPASAGPAAPAHGLYLMRVDYEEMSFEGLDSTGLIC